MPATKGKGKQKKSKGTGQGRYPRDPKGNLLPRRQRGRRTSAENEELLDLLRPSEQDVMKMLAASTHIGRRKADASMNRYIWKKRPDGVNIINLEKTWAKIILAARILVTVRNPADIYIMSTRPYGQRGAIKFAHYTHATPLVGKWTPGAFTNPRNKAFVEPRLLIVDDPVSCFAALRETSYTGIPVIALMGTDNNARFVDCGIPCNNRGKFSIGLMFWLLARELLRMRGDPTCIRATPWKESVDLFFYRDADEIKRQQDAKKRKAERAQQALQGYAPNAPQQPMVDDMDQYDDQMAAQDYGQQPMAQAQDMYAPQGQIDDYGQPMAQGQDYGMPQDNWDMPQGQDIEDWDQGDAQPQQPMGGYEQPQQVQQDMGGYEQQPPQQGGYQPQYGDQDGAMGMQTW